jgi:hypothetical protein
MTARLKRRMALSAGSVSSTVTCSVRTLSAKVRCRYIWIWRIV